LTAADPTGTMTLDATADGAGAGPEESTARVESMEVATKAGLETGATGSGAVGDMEERGDGALASWAVLGLAGRSGECSGERAGRRRRAGGRYFAAAGALHATVSVALGSWGPTASTTSGAVRDEDTTVWETPAAAGTSMSSAPSGGAHDTASPESGTYDVSRMVGAASEGRGQWACVAAVSANSGGVPGRGAGWRGLEGALRSSPLFAWKHVARRQAV
jgi:hypothetical protein